MSALLENAVLVTGAGRRVGYHVAQRLHEQGYWVLAHYRTPTTEIQALSELGVKTIQADLSSKAEIFNFVEQVKSQCHSFRALIHNASSFEKTSTDFDKIAEQYQQFFTIHMLAPYLINHGLADRLNGEEEVPADIIHITDINVENPTPEYDVYGTTKAGLHNMTLALAKRLAPKIKVNAIAPGPVLFTPEHSLEAIEKMLGETPLAKEGGAEPIYLAVKAIMENSFLTGCSIPVDGGRRLAKS